MRASDLFENPDHLLHAIHFGQGICQFLEAYPATYERSSFLDDRIMHAGGRTLSVDLAELARTAGRVRKPAHPPAFLAHTSFCCSTLLARSLAFSRRSFVLREPQVLLMLARAYREHPDLFPGPAARAHLSLVLRLLNKSYGDDRVIIKPSNLANRLLPDWLQMHSRARGLVITCGLESYLVSVLRKSPATRDKMPWVARSLSLDSDYLDLLPELDRPVTDPLEAAAVAWHAQRYQLGQLRDRFPGRVLVVDQEDLLTAPAGVLADACRHLEIDVPESELKARVRGPLWTRHAKDPRHAYDASRRRSDHARIRRLNAGAIDRALAFLAPALERVPDPLAGESRELDHHVETRARSRATEGKSAQGVRS